MKIAAGKERVEMTSLNRRHFIQSAAACAGASLLIPASSTAQVLTKPFLGSKLAKKLSIYNIHTGEFLKKVTFMEDGKFVQQSLKEINHFFRDHRTNQAFPIDPSLLNILHQISDKFDHKTIHLVSGYRSPKSNNMLRGNSRGVAKKSMHLEGKAADIFFEHVPMKNLQKIALNLQSGGVGGYPSFVHVDTGRLRHW